MKVTGFKSALIHAGVLILVLSNWWLGADLVDAYGPINDLIGQVDQLRQTGAIFEGATASNLIANLQNIGNLVDAGDRASASQLLTAFNQEVNSMSGVLMTPAAAGQLVNGATTVAAGL